MTRRQLGSALIVAGLAGVSALGRVQAGPVSGFHLPAPRTATAASLTGSYERKFQRQFDGSLEIRELPGHRIKFEITALQDLNSPGGPRDMEEAGTISVQRETAVYRSNEDGITLTFRFRGRKIYVAEEQTNFSGAYAGGTYVRTSKKPEFRPPLND